MADMMWYLAGKLEGMTVQREGRVAKLVDGSGKVVREMHCLTNDAAIVETFSMAEEAYKNAEAK